jgi:hypothetical protein
MLARASPAIYVPKTLDERIGCRRVALECLRAGELLSLRLPEEAAWLLSLRAIQVRGGFCAWVANVVVGDAPRVGGFDG